MRSRPQRFRTVLQAGLRRLQGRTALPLDAVPVLISGMASASIGWCELPYARLPLALDGTGIVASQPPGEAGEVAERRILLISGARTGSDVMRGEETQVLGLFQLPLPAALAQRSLVIMPGTHSKHLWIDDCQVRDFRTFMTGELFDVISRHSILRHSIGAAPDDAAFIPPDRDAFRAGVIESQTIPLPAALFHVRTRQLLEGPSEASNRAFLSGVLIGCELASLRSEQPDRSLLLCAAPPLDQLYAVALEALELDERLTTVSPDDVARLSALGQAVVLRNLGGA